MKTLNERYHYGLELFLLSIDEGITGYRDDSLEVRRVIPVAHEGASSLTGMLCEDRQTQPRTVQHAFENSVI